MTGQYLQDFANLSHKEADIEINIGDKWVTLQPCAIRAVLVPLEVRQLRETATKGAAGMRPGTIMTRTP